jgi:hypothetical protein
MSKEEGVRTVVVGGKQDVPQQYCGIVGGQSTDFTMVDTEVKVKATFFVIWPVVSVFTAVHETEEPYVSTPGPVSRQIKLSS